MSNLRLRDPVFGDNFESALRRFFSPTVFERDEPQLQMKIDVSENADSCSERYYGTISRAFSLGQDVDDTKAQAKYADGVLALELPKKATASARKVTVQ